MYLTHEELMSLDPTLKVTAEEWTAMSLQIDALVDRLTFGVIEQGSVMSIPTLAERVKRAVAVEARAIATKRMVEEAERMGADAVVNIRYSSSAVMQGAAEVMAYGTAVKFR